MPRTIPESKWQPALRRLAALLRDRAGVDW